MSKEGSSNPFRDLGELLDNAVVDLDRLRKAGPPKKSMDIDDPKMRHRDVCAFFYEKMSVKQISRQVKGLSPADIEAERAFYQEHKEHIDLEIRDQYRSESVDYQRSVARRDAEAVALPWEDVRAALQRMDDWFRNLSKS